MDTGTRASTLDRKYARSSSALGRSLQSAWTACLLFAAIALLSVANLPTLPGDRYLVTFSSRSLGSPASVGAIIRCIWVLGGLLAGIGLLARSGLLLGLLLGLLMP
jgi:hypothetical protein